VRVAKPNFSFQKRQREQERARKKQEKMQRKLERANEPASPDLDGTVPDGAARDADAGVESPPVKPAP
jgi:hypothetical protein